METKKKRTLDFNKIAHRVTNTISTAKALENVYPIQWSDDVLNGKRKVIITKAEEACAN